MLGAKSKLLFWIPGTPTPNSTKALKCDAPNGVINFLRWGQAWDNNESKQFVTFRFISLSVSLAHAFSSFFQSSCSLFDFLPAPPPSSSQRASLGPEQLSKQRSETLLLGLLLSATFCQDCITTTTTTRVHMWLWKQEEQAFITLPFLINHKVAVGKTFSAGPRGGFTVPSFNNFLVSLSSSPLLGR